MKYVLAGLAGLIVGALAAAAVVYLNPLTANRAAPAEAAGSWQLAYSLPEPGVLTHTHGGWLPSPLAPPGVPELWEETIRSSALTSVRLLDTRDGSPAWATRISVPSTKTNLILNGLVVGDYWLVSKPGAGSLYLSAYTNLWPAVKDTYLRVDVLRRPWRGGAAYSPTLRTAGSPALLGATGRFAGIEGEGLETFEIDGYDAAAGLASVDGRLTLKLDADPFAEPAAESGAADAAAGP